MTHANETQARYVLARCRGCGNYVKAMGYGACKLIRRRDGRVDWQEFARQVDAGLLNDCDGFVPKGT